MDKSNSILGTIVVFVSVAIIVLIIAFIVVTVGSTIGTVWGAGNATINYAKSFKEVVYDGNIDAAHAA